jgi:elongation factor G
MIFPLRMKIEPKAKADTMLLLQAIADLTATDPKLSFFIDAESGETILCGQHELHLGDCIDALKLRGVNANVGAPHVSYREALRQPSLSAGEHHRDHASGTDYARVQLRLEPVARGAGNTFDSTRVNGLMPQDHIDTIEKATRDVWMAGVLIGHPLDIGVLLLDVEWSDGPGTRDALRHATRAAITEGCTKAGIDILEPVMVVETRVGSSATNVVSRDFVLRRGKIDGQILSDDTVTISARVPLANLFGYRGQLLALSGGGASYSMTFSHYQVVEPTIATDPDRFPPAVGMRA